MSVLAPAATGRRGGTAAGSIISVKVCSAGVELAHQPTEVGIYFSAASRVQPGDCGLVTSTT